MIEVRNPIAIALISLVTGAIGGTSLTMMSSPTSTIDLIQTPTLQQAAKPETSTTTAAARQKKMLKDLHDRSDHVEKQQDEIKKRLKNLRMK